MLRYLGFILVVLMALAMTAGVAVILLGGLTGRLVAARAIRLTVFDAVGAAGASPPRFRAMIEDADSGRPMAPPWLVVRFDDGWTTWAWAGRSGVASAVGRPGLGQGAHGFTMALSEIKPRLDVRSGAAVWVRPPGVPVLWVEGAAVVPMEEPVAGTGAPPEVLGLLKTLATGRQAVYLVSSDAAHYASVRRRLRACGAPPGPVFWMKPKEEPGSLAALRGVWPRIEAAVVCTAAMADAAARLKAPVGQVPACGPEPGAAAWRGVLERFPAPPAPRPDGGEAK